MAQGRARDVPTQTFEFLSLLGSTRRLSMQAKPLGTDTALGVRLGAGYAQCRVFPGQHFLAYPGAKRDAVGASRRVQRGQGRIGIRVGQVRDLGVFLNERALTRQHLQQPGDDPREPFADLISLRSGVSDTTCFFREP